MKQITITIPKSYYEKIEKLKEDSTWSRSLIVREALKDFLDKYSVGADCYGQDNC